MVLLKLPWAILKSFPLKETHRNFIRKLRNENLRKEVVKYEQECLHQLKLRGANKPYNT